ncbi:Uncharacterised protein [Mycobacteroides abscessus subsp. abscessus]|nr:Uncharacterised protein [Mycobacteroides abscessus subsp. abscessus]
MQPQQSGNIEMLVGIHEFDIRLVQNHHADGRRLTDKLIDLVGRYQCSRRIMRPAQYQCCGIGVISGSQQFVEVGHTVVRQRNRNLNEPGDIGQYRVAVERRVREDERVTRLAQRLQHLQCNPSGTYAHHHFLRRHPHAFRDQPRQHHRQEFGIAVHLGEVVPERITHRRQGPIGVLVQRQPQRAHCHWPLPPHRTAAAAA